MPRLAHARSLFVIYLLAVALPATTAAQPAGNVTLDPFRPAIDSRGYMTVNASEVLGHGELSFGLGSLDWGHRLLELDADGKSYSIDDMVTATLVAALGLQLGPATLEVGVSLPLRIMSGNRGPDSLGDPATPNDDRAHGLDGQGLGNIGLHLKSRLRAAPRDAGVGLGVIASLYLPTVHATDRFLGDTQLVPQVIGIADRALGREQRLRIAVNGGIRLRRTTTFTNSDPGPGMAPVTGRSITAGSELPFGVGVAYAIAKQRFDVVGEVFGAVPLGAHHGYQPLEALAGVKLYLARNSYLTLGAGRGLMPERGANPDLRGLIGIVFEPAAARREGDGVAERDAERSEPPAADGGHVRDRDGDGIADRLDLCPDEPEDVDGFEDGDGCPDADNDRDGIRDIDDLCPDQPEDADGFEDSDGCPDDDDDRDRVTDRLDRCPDRPETHNGFEDGDGCPDRGVVTRVADRIVILRPINFEYDSAVIDPDSFYILDAVVAAMNGNPDIALFEVQGHTDERGDDAYNLDLSQRRAAAVVTYLVAHGVAAARLASQGYGETRPVHRGRGEAAWAKNRRVDFVIRRSVED
jgi:OmpA-OmpF porin, OOP family